MENNLIGKSFIFDGEEYIIEEILSSGKRCIARNLNFNIKEQFYTDHVREFINFSNNQ